MPSTKLAKTYVPADKSLASRQKSEITFDMEEETYSITSLLTTLPSTKVASANLRSYALLVRESPRMDVCDSTKVKLPPLVSTS